MLAFERPDGKQEMIRLSADQLEEGVEQGRKWLQNNPEGATRAVLVIDALITLESGKTDALVIEAVRFVPERASFTMAVPYRNAEDPSGFAVHRPKFLDANGFEPNYVQIGEAFFAGIEAHEQGSKVWDTYIDEGQSAAPRLTKRCSRRPTALRGLSAAELGRYAAN